jgi:hypothetical protein
MRKHFSLLCIGLLTILSVVAQNSLQQWKGNYVGELFIYKPDGSVAQQVSMELEVKPTADSTIWIWKTTYNHKDTRDYVVLIKDAAKGKYVLDEKNGILIDIRAFGNKLISCYDVEGYLIYDSHTLNGNEIIFELTSSSSDQNHTSGGKDDIPVVKSMPQVTYQRAVLKRQ